MQAKHGRPSSRTAPSTILFVLAAVVFLVLLLREGSENSNTFKEVEIDSSVAAAIEELEDNQVHVVEEEIDESEVITPAAFGNSTPVHAIVNGKRNYMIRYGTAYGGYNLPALNRTMHWLKYPKEKIVVYGFGVGEDISWDVSLASVNPDMIEMNLFDPTPRAKRHYEAVKYVIETGKIPGPYPGGHPTNYIHPISHEVLSVMQMNREDWFGEVAKAKIHIDKFTLHPYGLWVNDTQLEFFIPETGVSHSFVRHGSGKKLIVEARTLESLMKMLGHTKIDILKFDIEGAEVLVVPNLISFFKKANVWPKMILFDHDARRHKVEGEATVLSNLEAAGYVLFSYAAYDAVYLHSSVWSK